VNRRFPEIARQLKCTVEEVQAAADVVATLNPRRARGVERGTKYVVPDLIVERVDDEYVVLLNDRQLPRLRISSAYESVLREKKKRTRHPTQAKTREYIQGKLNSARWLIQTIEQRRRTMIKVMNCIIREQREFFDKGIAFLRPLTLQQVARQIDMHESTVSSRVQRQVRSDPARVFELKFFFSSGLETEDGEDVSARTAKDIIKTLIDEEDKKEPLSDQRIASSCTKRASDRARTVAKYREQLSILPARSAAGRVTGFRAADGDRRQPGPRRDVMHIITTARHFDSSPTTGVRPQRLERVGRSARRSQRVEAHLTVTAERNRHVAEILAARAPPRTGEPRGGADPRVAIELAGDGLERQHAPDRRPDRRARARRRPADRRRGPPGPERRRDDTTGWRRRRGGLTPRGERQRRPPVRGPASGAAARTLDRIARVAPRDHRQRHPSPGMALMGFVENFLPERIQILAQTELTYLATLTPGAVRLRSTGCSSSRCR
jgi:hypothetical protein